MAFSSMTSSPITLSMAQQMLKHMVHGAERRTSAESIIRAVADRYNLQPAQLKIKTNAHHIALPRQVAMYLIKELTQASLPEIGRLFGGKHHTTVLHSVHKIEELRHKDRELNSLLHSLLETFH
jgi:chromosomal replication initiator protein